MALLISFLPTLMLSGFIFPIAQHAARRCSSSRYVVPARYFLVALRGIVLKGAELAPPAGRSSARWRSTRPSMLALAVGAAGAGSAR